MLNKLRASNPKYDKAIKFVLVDWDTFRSHEVTTSRRIPRRSTLVLTNGDREKWLVAKTSEQEIKELLDHALKE